MSRNLPFLLAAMALGVLAIFQAVTIYLDIPYILVASGDSMYPTLKPNDLLIIERVKLDDIRIGDIVVADYGSFDPLATGYIVHRVVNFSNAPDNPMILTKGDNNPNDDGAYSAKYVIGKLSFSLPLIGLIIAPPVNFVLIIVFIVLFSFFRAKR